MQGATLLDFSLSEGEIDGNSSAFPGAGEGDMAEWGGGKMGCDERGLTLSFCLMAMTITTNFSP
jgi:hypothetical protein